jgi:hypothetical protein
MFYGESAYMQQWHQIISRAFGDTWDLVVGQTFWTIMIAVAVFAVGFLIARKWRGKDYAQDWFTDAVIGFCSIVLVAIGVFCFEVIFVAPAKIIKESQEQVSDLTNQVNTLQSNNTVLIGETNTLQKQVDGDNSALVAVAAVTGYTNRAFAQNAEDILSKLNKIGGDVQKVKNRLYAAESVEKYKVGNTNHVMVRLSPNQGPSIFFRLKYRPIGGTVQATMQCPTEQSPLIMNGIDKNVIWSNFPNGEDLNQYEFIFSYLIDTENTNIIDRVYTNNGNLFFDNVAVTISYPDENNDN